jgi:hypothetical protein
VKIGTEMKLPRPVLQEILLGSLLHDVGKIGFKDDILSKPLAQMNIEETNMHRSHTKNGQEALEALGDMEKVSLIVRSHHEMWDGSGYPDNLAGDRVGHCVYQLHAVADEHAAQVVGDVPFSGPEAATRLVEETDADVVLNTVGTMLQVTASVAAIEAHLDTALAWHVHADHVEHLAATLADNDPTDAMLQRFTGMRRALRATRALAIPADVAAHVAFVRYTLCSRWHTRPGLA